MSRRQKICGLIRNYLSNIGMLIDPEPVNQASWDESVYTFEPDRPYALYRYPEDTDAFDKAYFETHIPLIKKVPGLQSVEANKVSRVVVGSKAPYMIATMTFADKDVLKAGMNSPEMAAAGENLDGFA
ncbi:MAG: EthD family reductase [Chloroflexota bacterium]